MRAKLISRSFLGLAFCACLAPALLPQGTPVQSSETRPGVKIDGQTGDWPASGRIIDAKSGLEVTFQNNDRDLYILIVVKKPQARASLESTGMTVLVHSGESKTAQGVLFLKRTVPAQAYIQWHESQGTFLTQEEKAKLQDAVQQDLCLTFAVGATGSIYGPLRYMPENDRPEFAAFEEPAATLYELKIPLASPDLVPGGLGVSPGDTFRISFEWGGAARKTLSPKTTMEPAALELKADVSGSGVTWAQEFLDMFDSMSRPTRGTKKFSFAAGLRLAEARQ